MDKGNFNETAGRYVLDIALKQQLNMHDSVFLVGGMEGSGKSNFILECINYIDNKRGTETPITNIAYNLEDFFMTLKTSSPCDVIALDEGKELMNMNYGDKRLKDAVNIFTVIRKKRLITFLAFTNPSKITQYFREDRIRGVFILKKRMSGVTFINFYTKAQFLRNLAILKTHNELNIAGVLRFQPMFSIWMKGAYDGRLKQIYEEAKDENIELQLDKLVAKYHDKKITYYNVRQAYELIGCSDKTFKKVIPTEFRAKYKDSFGNIKFTDEAIEEIKEMFRKHKENSKPRGWHLMKDYPKSSNSPIIPATPLIIPEKNQNNLEIDKKKDKLLSQIRNKLVEGSKYI